MPTEPIRRVGPYEVVRALGQGGMGTVFLARDSRLGRQVALKFISGDHLAALPDDGARDRLLREARAASALNHPNVCQVYDVGGEGRDAWVAMEYVEGESLAARLRARGPLPAAEVMALGRQIAEALAHAHHRGILHRDLKGANIVCDREGRPKILDFGIARQLVADIAGEVTRTTAAAPLAQAIEGTLPYMAPEAIRGAPQDERSDLWSLGIVLHELVTGQLPFAGRNSLDLAAEILNRSPAPMPDSAPPALAAVVNRLLSKDPANRHGTAAEVAAALAMSTEAVAARPAPVQRWWSPGRLAAAAALAAVAVLAAWQWWPRGGLQLAEQRLVSTQASTAQWPSYSPDRSMLAYVAPDASGVPQVWVQQTAAGTSIQLTSGKAGASRPRWMPGTNRILFALAGQGLWTVALGGTPNRLIERGSSPNISRDGRLIVFEDQRSIVLANADGSGVRKVDGPSPEFYLGIPRSPALSPDGSTIAYFHPERGPNGDFWIVPSSGGTPRRLTSDLREGGSPVWTADGRTIIFSSARAGSRTLWQMPAAGGEPTPLTVGAGEDDQPDISSDGRQLAYMNVRHSWALRVRNLPNGEERTLLQRPLDLLFPMFSPDGGRIVFFGRADFAVAIFTIGANGEDQRQLTAGRELNHMPRWSGDGQDIYFFQSAPTQTFRRISALGGASTAFRDWEWETSTTPAFDPTGRFVAYIKQRPPGSPPTATEHTVLHDLATGQERVWPEPHTHVGNWSPDGSSIVGWQHGPAGENRIAVCVVAEASCRQVTAGRMPRWSWGDGRLYFLRNAQGGTQDLWTIATDGTDERRLFNLGAFRAIDAFFDVSKRDEVVWAPFKAGDRQVWRAEVK
jgi:Tol biopolymer transport system component/predicted Ser/Thr protein kinase